MSCCCDKILELCKVPVCGTALIKTGVNAPAAGDYKLTLDYLGVNVVLNATFEVDEPFDFPASDLNEDYKYTGKITQEDGTPVTITVDEVVYDCISFQTVLEYQMNPED